jgi:hypothetical protein
MRLLPAIAFSELLYTEAGPLKWLFPQEKASLTPLKKSTRIPKML